MNRSHEGEHRQGLSSFVGTIAKPANSTRRMWHSWTRSRTTYLQERLSFGIIKPKSIVTTGCVLFCCRFSVRQSSLALLSPICLLIAHCLSFAIPVEVADIDLRPHAGHLGEFDQVGVTPWGCQQWMLHVVRFTVQSLAGRPG